MQCLPKAVIYDWDNTLIDSWQVILTSLNVVFEKYQKPLWTLDDMKHKSHRSARDMMPEEFGNQWEEAYNFFYQHIEANHCKALKTLDGALSVLQFFKNRNIPQYVLSNKKGHILRKEVNYLGWDDFFVNIVGSGDHDHDKPHPSIVPFVLGTALSPTTDTVWFIGDTPVDWSCAKDTNCTAIAVTDVGYETTIVPDYTFLNIKDFAKQLVERL